MFCRATTGERPDPVAVLVHGLGESGLCFERIALHPALAPWRVIVPDLPGYGRSAWADPPLPLASLADRLAQWLAERLASPVAIVGHSMGGVVAQLLAERHPRRVRCVIDVDGNLSTGDCTFSSRAAAVSLQEHLGGRFEALCDAVYRQGARCPAHRGYYASLRLCDPRAFHLHARELEDLSRGEGLARRLAALSMPVHFVAGVPGGAAPRSLELLAEAGLRPHLIDPSGHWPFLDRPDEFASVLGRVLAALPPPPPAPAPAPTPTPIAHDARSPL
jgi:pimeloyl-ACP methyl ester carboxylesterase